MVKFGLKTEFSEGGGEDKRLKERERESGGRELETNSGGFDSISVAIEYL